jgi:hypothetical protein
MGERQALINSDAATVLLVNLLVSYLSAQGIIARDDFLETIQDLANSDHAGTGPVADILKSKIAALAGAARMN